jgi:hypothetical protein
MKRGCSFLVKKSRKIDDSICRAYIAAIRKIIVEFDSFKLELLVVHCFTNKIRDSLTKYSHSR